jgi:hypothetical protein
MELEASNSQSFAIGGSRGKKGNFVS